MSLSTCLDLHPVFGDIEASGLDDASYPIEIGWSLPDGRTRSFLIKPEPEWTHWDEAAEDLHGISREELEKNGLPPVLIAAKMNQDLVGLTLFFDGGKFDKDWITKLFAAAGISPAFDVSSVYRLLFPEHKAYMERLDEMQANAEPGQVHRAEADVRMMVDAYKALRPTAHDLKLLAWWPTAELRTALCFITEFWSKRVGSIEFMGGQAHLNTAGDPVNERIVDGLRRNHVTWGICCVRKSGPTYVFKLDN